MAASTRIELRLDGLKALEKGLKSLPQAIPGVTSASLNYAVDRMYTEAWRTIKPEFFLKQKYFARATKKIRANPTKLVAALLAIGKHLPFSRFKFSPTRPRRKGQPASAVSVMLGPNRTAVVPPSAFIATMNKQGQNFTGVFMRGGAARYPISQPLTNIGPAEMLADAKVRDTLDTISKEAYSREFRRLTKVKMDAAFKGMPK